MSGRCASPPPSDHLCRPPGRPTTVLFPPTYTPSSPRFGIGSLLFPPPSPFMWTPKHYGPKSRLSAVDIKLTSWRAQRSVVSLGPGFVFSPATMLAPPPVFDDVFSKRKEIRILTPATHPSFSVTRLSVFFSRASISPASPVLDGEVCEVLAPPFPLAKRRSLSERPPRQVDSAYRLRNTIQRAPIFSLDIPHLWASTKNIYRRAQYTEITFLVIVFRASDTDGLCIKLSHLFVVATLPSPLSLCCARGPPHAEEIAKSPFGLIMARCMSFLPGTFLFFFAVLLSDLVCLSSPRLGTILGWSLCPLPPLSTLNQFPPANGNCFLSSKPGRGNSFANRGTAISLMTNPSSPFPFSYPLHVVWSSRRSILAHTIRSVWQVLHVFAFTRFLS